MITVYDTTDLYSTLKTKTFCFSYLTVEKGRRRKTKILHRAAKAACGKIRTGFLLPHVQAAMFTFSST